MRNRTVVVTLAVGLAVLLADKSAWAEESNPCAQVSCSNHGNCVVANGRPVCACHEGYAPDTTTGLSCQPVTQTTLRLKARDPGWALGGAVVGFIGMAIGTGLGGTSAALAPRSDGLPSGIVGFSSVVVFGVMGPIAYSGGKSARVKSGAMGVRGLRIAAWIAYGGCLADGLVLLGLGAAGVSIDPWPIVGSTLLGVTSLLLFSIDAIKSRNQALGHEEQPPRTVILLPNVAPVVGRDGVTGGVVGLVGHF